MKNIIKQNCFYDSIMLMQITELLSKKFGSNITLMMGTDANKTLLKEQGLLNATGEKAHANDLIICCDEKINEKEIIEAVDNYLKDVKVSSDEQKLLQEQQSVPSDTNLVVISIPGEFVYHEVKKIITDFEPSLQKEKILNHNMCIFIFSDNVPIEEEIKLKQLAVKKDILILGPDCGTAIVNGIGLGFANVVRIARNNETGIGVISAGGSGLQAIVSTIHKYGYKITEAIGVGGRDLSEKVGGITTIESIKVLEQDRRTKVIILFSKPPSDKIVKKIVNYLKYNCKKKYVVNFLGCDKYKDTDRIKFVSTTYEAVIKAVELLRKTKLKKTETKKDINEIIKNYVVKFKTSGRKYIRGLYSGGSLCEEAMVVLNKNNIKDVYSNVPLNSKYKLPSPWSSVKHTIIDFGDDFFTRGKPHPMIDFTFRKERLLTEANDKSVAVIMFDIILGIGAHLNPVKELKQTLLKMQKLSNREILLCCTVIGTQKDPQNLKLVESQLRKLGVLVFDTNVEMVEFVSKIVKMLQ